MTRKLLIAAILLLIVPTLVLAQAGKMRGIVSDKETGEPLIGANVMIEGTTLGASTDMNGIYVILAVPPGVHSVRATYIGYTTEVIVASIRNPLHVVDAALIGADISTIPFSVIEQLVNHPLTDKGIERFLSDWKKIPKSKQRRR